MLKPRSAADAGLSERESHARELLDRAAHLDDPHEADRLRNIVILENRPLASGLARRFYRRGIEREDLLQVSLLGLVHAANRYRPGAGPGFTAFAVPTITGELKRHFRDHGWAVRPPRALQELHRDVRGATADLLQALQREPTAREIADRLAVPVSSVNLSRQLDMQYQQVSLDGRWPGGDDDKPLGELLPDPSDPFSDIDDVLTLRPLLEALNEDDRFLIRLRFVDRLTQRQIGALLSVSQTQVSRLLRDVLGRLRARLTDMQPQAFPS